MNAATNPFRGTRLAALAYVGTTTGVELALRASALAYRCAIVGPTGSGKSTLLQVLADAMSVSSTPHELTRFDRLPPLFRFRRGRTVLLVDGAEKLSLIALRALIVTVPRLVITAERLPRGLRCLHRCTRDSAVLDRLMEQLDPTGAWRAHASASWTQHRGDLHIVFDDLYERAAAE